MLIDNLIILGFLIITFITGIRHAKGITTMSDYALGGRNFSTGAIVATLVATYTSGSGFFIDLSKVYSDGLYYIIAASSMVLSFFISAFLFIPRMGEFLGQNSIAESMGGLYGKNIRIITAVTGIIASIGVVAVQFKVFGNLFSYFLGFSNTKAILISAVLVTTYSAFGGIKSVTFTDVIQIITFGIAIPLVGIIIWNQFYYDGFSFTNSLADPKFSFNKVFNLENPKLIHMIPLLLYFSMPGLNPVVCQRILIGNNLQQVKKAFIIAAGVLLIIQLIFAWIPFLIFNVDSNLVPSQLLGYIIDNYTYVGLKGLLVAGIVAMAMSTADSYINTSSVLFSNDICIPLKLGKNKELLLSKIFAFFMGGIGLILALSTQDLLSIILAANSFYMPIVTVPLMFSILGFRSSTQSVLIGMSAGFTTVIIWKILEIEADVIIFAMLVNLIFLMGSHYLLKQKGGWVGIKDNISFEQLKQTELKQKTESLRRFRNISFVDYCKKNFPNNELSYVGLGVYLMIYAVSTMYSTRAELLKENAQMILVFYQILLVSGTILFVYPIWPRGIEFEKKQTFAQCVWPIVITSILIFFNTFFVLVSDFQGVQFGMFSINLLVASILLGWRVFAICAASGLYLAFELHQFYDPNYILDIEIGSPAFIATYTLMLIGASTILFIKPRQEQVEQIEDKNECLKKEIDYTQRELDNIKQGFDFLEKQFEQKAGNLKEKEVYLRDQVKIRNTEISKLTNIKDEFLRNITHESNTPMTGIISMSEVLYSCYDKLDNKLIKRTIKDIVNSSDRLKTYVNSVVDLSKLSSSQYKLNKEAINLGELAKERTFLYKKVFSDDETKQEFIFNIGNDFIINCDRYYITQTIDNLISNASNYGRGKSITISIKREEGFISFSISDQGIGIPETELLSIFAKFSTSSRTSTPSGGRGVGLALCKSVIEAHEGIIKATSSKGKGTIFTFTLPNVA